MKSVKIDLSRDIKMLEIHTFADLHLGDKNCNTAAINENIKRVIETPNAYVILNGDIMNNNTRTSIGDSYSEQLSPMEQIKRAVDLFGPIKDKILAITTGNHEARTYKKEGIDLSEIMARELGLADRFSAGAVILFLRFGEMLNGKKEHDGSGRYRRLCYSIYCLHGSGGGRKEGAKAIRLADMASIIDADIYVHSHTHLPMVMREGYFRVDIKNSTVQHVSKLFVNTSAMLEYGGYGEVMEFKPISIESPTIYLNGTKKLATARL